MTREEFEALLDDLEHRWHADRARIMEVWDRLNDPSARRCVGCGNAFTHKRTDQIYCSSRCSARQRMRAMKDRRAS